MATNIHDISLSWDVKMCKSISIETTFQKMKPLKLVRVHALAFVKPEMVDSGRFLERSLQVY